MSQGLAQVLKQIHYAKAADYLQTETSPELDLASVDFFGPNALPRPVGMSDANFYALILAQLFKSAVTRQAISDAIFAITGVRPRLIEPWNPADTGCRDTLVSFRDVDTTANPMRNTSGYLAWNGFIETVLPNSAVLGGLNPLLTRDDGGFRDANEYRLTIPNFPSNSIYNAVNAVRAFGTTVWIRFVASVP